MDKLLRLEIGDDELLTKPYNFRKLLVRVRTLLLGDYSELAPAASNMLDAGGQVINRSPGRISRGNQLPSLTASDFCR